MKKKMLIVVLAVMTALCAFSATACGTSLFKVSFIVDNEIYHVLETGGKEQLTLPATPTKEGYNFDGWYFDKDVWQRPFTASSLLEVFLAGDTSVYAKFSEAHTHAHTEQVVAPTCTEKGYTIYTCACGDTYTANEVEALGHVEEQLYAPTVTCTQAGLTAGTKCSTCNVILEEQQKVEATGHDYTQTIVAPTCTQEGYTTYACACGVSYTDNIVEALGHDFDEEIIAPTCLTKGYTIYTCDCGYEYIDSEVEATGHSYSEEQINNNCTLDGYTIYTCDCGASYVGEFESATGHDYTIVVTMPSCTEAGKTECECSCGDTHTSTFGSALGHVEVEMPAVEPTCTESGLTAGVKCSVCNEIFTAQREVEAIGHSYTSVVTDPTCTEQGYTTHSCNYCDDEYTDTYTQTISHNYVGGYCSVCNAPQVATQLYTRVDANGTQNAQGQYILFGSYPQTDVTESMGSTLSSYKGTLPTSSNSGTWTSYGYYISGSVTNFMWYKDITHTDGNKYRAVYFTSYRPYYTTGSSGSTYQDDNGYTTSTVYWFKYEPIKWRILSESGGKATLLAEMIIDSQAYQNTYTYSGSSYYATDEQGNILTDGQGNKIYANNYAYSTIREWLNDDFYNTAFSIAEQGIIQTTTVDNSVASTLYSSNPYVCENTQDKVYLMSAEEMTRTAYGFNSEYYDYDEARERQNTDYAKVQGAWTYTSSSYYGNGSWWLRSPYGDYSDYARYVFSDGYVDSGSSVYITNLGVVPALQIELS